LILRGSSERAEALGSLVGALVELGEIDRANAIAQSADPSELRESVLASLARARKFDLADNVVRSIHDSSERYSAQLPMVTALAEAGELDRAEALVELHNRRDQPARLISLVRRADRRHGARFLGRAMMLAPWHTVLPTLVTVSPGTLRTAVDELARVANRAGG
jgi:hypothetical protein